MLGKNITHHFFTLLLVFQSSLFFLSVRVLHRHLMFMVDHHHLNLHWSKIEFLGLNKGYMLEILNVVLYFLKLTSFLSHYGFYCFYLQLLKRRNSVLDSDIGSVGPIRRIRHKLNLLSSKSSRTAIGGSPLSATGTGARSDMPLSLIEKPHVLGESNPKFSKTLMETGDNRRPGVSFAHVPSQSSEMAEKILPQLAACMPYSRVNPTTTMKVCWGKI